MLPLRVQCRARRVERRRVLQRLLAEDQPQRRLGQLRAVFDAQVGTTLSTVPIDATDLPEYAGRLFDYYCENPLINRLATWARLERGSDAFRIEAIVEANLGKIAAIAAEQDAGRLSRRFTVPVLLLLILTTAGMWVTAMPEYETVLGGKDGIADPARRAIIVDAVRLLVEQR